MKLVTEGSAEKKFPGELVQILDSNIEHLEPKLEFIRKLLASRKRALKGMLSSKPAIPDLPISMLGFSRKALRGLLQADIETLRGIVRLSKGELNMIKSFSLDGYWDIVNRLREFGIDLNS